MAGRLKGVAALLAELELDKYAEAFAAAGYDDASLGLGLTLPLYPYP